MWIDKADRIVPHINIPIRPIHKSNRIFENIASSVRINNTVAVIVEPKAVANSFASGEGDTVQVATSLGPDAPEGRIGVGLDGFPVFVRQRRDGPEAVGMENPPVPRRAADESDPLDGLVHSRPIDVRPHDLVARVNFHHHVGTIIDEPGGKAIVQALSDAVALAIEGVIENRAVGVELLGLSRPTLSRA